MEKDIIIDYIQKFGNSASIGLLHPLCKFFKSNQIDGIIGYRNELNCSVVIGDPLCQKNCKIKIAQEFYNLCKEQNQKIIYILISKEFAKQLLSSFKGSALQFGHEILIENKQDIKKSIGRYPRHLRQKYKYSISQGLTAYEYIENNNEIEKNFLDIANNWLKNRNWTQAYLLPLDIFSFRENKRWFYAKKDNQIVGFLMLNKINAISSWVLNGSVILKLNAPSSTSEFLILHVLDTLRNENLKSLSIGPTISPKIENMLGLSFISRALIRISMLFARKILKMDHRQKYWKKFHPTKNPSYIVFNSPFISIKEALAILKTFNMKLFQ